MSIVKFTHPARVLADQAFARSAGAPLVGGNQVRILYDASENYPAWEQTIAGARRCILLEMYILANDRTGNRFVDLLAQKARAGVQVYVLYDWFGAWRAAFGGLFRRLAAAGAQVRACNPPSLLKGLAAARRDHRKLLVVDEEVAFISGLCIGDDWLGDPDSGIQPWRDTGVEIRGPAVADAQWTFAESWMEAGAALPEDLLLGRDDIAPRGQVALRVIGTTPATASLYHLDLLVAALARETLWLTDAYFMGTTTYLQALRRAAGDGVDVRLLVPRTSDIGWIARISRTLYRPLLESGVRVFEWDGPMIHAKTAVADGRWARIGSTNLNLSSWLGNWELDVAIEDEGIGQQMEQRFLDDLEGATEIVLAKRRQVVLAGPRERPHRRGSRRGSARGAVRYAARLGSAMGAAVRGNRPLDAAEANSLLWMGAALLGIALAGWFHPPLIALPVTVVFGWVGLVLLGKALGLLRRRPSGARR